MSKRKEFFNFRSLRRRLEKRVIVWENDGGRVPNGENYYLVKGHLVTGWLGYVGWHAHRLWRRMSVMFVNSSRTPLPHSTF